MNTQEVPWYLLPTEILYNILLDSSYDDIVNFCFSHTGINTLCDDDNFWRDKWERDKNLYPNAKDKPEDITYKYFYYLVSHDLIKWISVYYIKSKTGYIPIYKNTDNLQTIVTKAQALIFNTRAKPIPFDDVERKIIPYDVNVFYISSMYNPWNESKTLYYPFATTNLEEPLIILPKMVETFDVYTQWDQINNIIFTYKPVSTSVKYTPRQRYLLSVGSRPGDFDWE